MKEHCDAVRVIRRAIMGDEEVLVLQFLSGDMPIFEFVSPTAVPPDGSFTVTGVEITVPFAITSA